MNIAIRLGILAARSRSKQAGVFSGLGGAARGAGRVARRVAAPALRRGTPARLHAPPVQRLVPAPPSLPPDLVRLSRSGMTPIDMRRMVQTAYMGGGNPPIPGIFASRRAAGLQTPSPPIALNRAYARGTARGNALARTTATLEAPGSPLATGAATAFPKMSALARLRG